MILLDTCVLLWLTSEPGRLSHPAQAAIRDSAEYAYVSAITAWEIAWKNTLGQILLPMPPEQWFASAIQQHQLQELAITSAIAIRSALLPRLHHDPAGRFLAATAQQQNLTLVTPDPEIHKYPDLKTVW